MKILFPLIKSGSGTDIFTSNLVSGLNKQKINSTINLLPGWSGFYPNIAGRRCNLSGYDIVHVNTWSAYAFKKDIPLVATEHHVVHDPSFEQYKTSGQKTYHKLIYYYESKSLEKADIVTCVSRYTQKLVKETFGYSDSHLVYNGIDTEIFRPYHGNRKKYGIPEDKIILLNVGNLSNRKGTDLLIPIMNKLDERFILVTTAGLQNRKRIKSSRIVTFDNINLNALVDLYNLSDMLLFPTRLEGFGLCVAEAMACELPIITTNCSSLPELVEDDKGGILCELDDISGFCNAIRYLSEDRDLRMNMGNYNIKKVKTEFYKEKMVNKYIEIYKKALTI